MPKSYETLLIEDRSKTRWITLNRPEVMNALSPSLVLDLREAVLEAEADSAIHCIVIRGSKKNFSAGMDLTAARNPKVAQTYGPRGFITLANKAMWAIWENKKPVIALVEGYCLGGGFELAMTCDFVYGDEVSKFGEPEVRLADAPPFLISPWVMGLRQAKHILLTGDIINAEKALLYGILNEVCKAGELESRVEKLALKLEAMPQETWHFNKRTVNRVYEIMGFHASIDLGMDMFATIKTTPNELKEGLTGRINSEGFAAAIKWAQSRYPKD